MTDLAALQQAFQDRVLHGRPDIHAALVGAGQADFADRIGAYVDGYRARLVEALATTYEGLQFALGEARFDALMRDYIAATPSTWYSIRDYGAGVADHLARTLPDDEGRCLSELAAWEWTLAAVFDAAEDSVLPLAAMGSVAAEDWPRLCFRLRACVRLARTGSNAVAWWRAAGEQADRPTAFFGAEPVDWVLWRRGVRTFYRSLEPDEAPALAAVAGGASFADLCAVLAESLPETEVALRAASLLRTWISEELVGSLALAPAG